MEAPLRKSWRCEGETLRTECSGEDFPLPSPLPFRRRTRFPFLQQNPRAAPRALQFLTVACPEAHALGRWSADVWAGAADICGRYLKVNSLQHREIGLTAFVSGTPFQATQLGRARGRFRGAGRKPQLSRSVNQGPVAVHVFPRKNLLSCPRAARCDSAVSSSGSASPPGLPRPGGRQGQPAGLGKELLCRGREKVPLGPSDRKAGLGSPEPCAGPR